MSKACTVITVRCLRSKTHIANDDFTCASTVCWMYAKWKILQCSSRNCYADQTKGPWSVMCFSRSWPDVPGNGVGVVSLPDVRQYWTSGYLAWNDFFIFCSVTTIGQFKCHPGNCLSTQNASKIALCIKKTPTKHQILMSSSSLDLLSSTTLLKKIVSPQPKPLVDLNSFHLISIKQGYFPAVKDPNM